MGSVLIHFSTGLLPECLLSKRCRGNAPDLMFWWGGEVGKARRQTPKPLGQQAFRLVFTLDTLPVYATGQASTTSSSRCISASMDSSSMEKMAWISSRITKSSFCLAIPWINRVSILLPSRGVVSI